MIIQCINCYKKFEVNSTLIPDSGRDIQCGSCNHIWFYDPENRILNEETQELKEEKILEAADSKVKNEPINADEKEIFIDKPKKNEKNKILHKANSKKSLNFNLSKILSYILVGIISFVALIIFLETFKSPLSSMFPGLELLLYNLFETIKDIFLFNKNLFL